MTLTETTVAGAFLLEYPRFSDSRGYFQRVWCEATMREQGLSTRISQVNTSANEKAGTLRGLHLQSAPEEEVKIVQCLKGSVFEVLVDLRAGSATYLNWFGVVLEELDPRQLYVPEGCAHGYQALVDGTVVQYSASSPYSPQLEQGIRWDDPVIGVDWPMEPVNVTDKDSSWPLLERS
jgi:dTDP-4-dehydrorhamnose 3,5-epimerase